MWSWKLLEINKQSFSTKVLPKTESVMLQHTMHTVYTRAVIWLKYSSQLIMSFVFLETHYVTVLDHWQVGFTFSMGFLILAFCNFCSKCSFKGTILEIVARGRYPCGLYGCHLTQIFWLINCHGEITPLISSALVYTDYLFHCDFVAYLQWWS